jgi:uncharacterized protein
MIVDLKPISDDPRHFNLTLERAWWPDTGEDGRFLGLDGPLDASLSISKTDQVYLLEGRLNGRLRIRCDRCLEPYSQDLDCDFSFSLAASLSDDESTEVELEEEDLSVEFVKEGQIELDEIIREQVYLSLPMKFQCRESCLGLCPVCGSDLNKTKCACQKKNGHPGFSKLKGLRFRGD